MSTSQKQKHLKLPPKSQGIAKLRAILENRGSGPVTPLTGTTDRGGIAAGTLMKDGTIYAGISPTTHKPMYAAPADATATMDFNEAAKFAKTLHVGSRKDFRMPDDAELQVLFDNRDQGALKGTFNESGKSSWESSGYTEDDYDDELSESGHWNSPGSYWSSGKRGADEVPSQDFSTGKVSSGAKDNLASIRCIR